MVRALPPPRHPPQHPPSAIPPLVTGDPQVVNGLATPIPVRLDGKTRTLTVDLETVTWRLTPATHIALQIIANTAVCNQQRAAGWITLSAKLALPRTTGSS